MACYIIIFLIPVEEGFNIILNGSQPQFKKLFIAQKFVRTLAKFSKRTTDSRPLFIEYS